MLVTVVTWKLDAAVNVFLAACTVCCGKTHDEDGDDGGGHLSPLVSTEIEPRRIATGALPQVRLMGLSSTDEQPGISERLEGTAVLQSESKWRSGAESISAVGIIAAAVCSDFYPLYCITPLPSPSLAPPHLFFFPAFYSKGHQPVRYSQAEADDHQRPIGSAPAPVTRPGSSAVAEGRTWGNAGVER